MLNALVALAVVVALLFFYARIRPHATGAFLLRIERRLAGLRLLHATTAEFEFAYLCGGSGGSGEALVLVHGFGADKDNFTRVARRLGKHFHVIVPDLPGFGDSDRLPIDAGYSFVDQAERLHQMLRAMGIERCHLAGNSMGGAIAIAYAARYPQDVASLWLLAPAGVDDAADSKLAAEYRATGRSLLVAETPDQFVDVFDLAVSRRPFLPRSVFVLLGQRAAADSALHKQIFDVIATAPGIVADARKITMPTLIVWGDEDQVLDVSGAALLDAAMPNSTVVIMPGIGHLAMLEAPAQSAADFITFIGSPVAKT